MCGAVSHSVPSGKANLGAQAIVIARRPAPELMTASTVEVMQCPHDQTLLQMTERQGIEIDYCPTCRGVWLDRGELDKIIERASTPAAPNVRRGEPQLDQRTEVAGYPAGYPQASAYPQYPPASARSPKSPDSPDDYYDRGHDPRHHDKRKRKSFLGDLFDF
jgi:Zn-finger nucleic acid-binding protein